MDKLTAALALFGIFVLLGLFANVAVPHLGYDAVGWIVIIGACGGAWWLARKMRHR